MSGNNGGNNGMKRSISLAAALFVVVGGLGAPNALANHPVLVEGNNCANAGPGTTMVPPGTCGDYDGDGLIGTAEDTDNATDRVFGTIGAALAAANGGANQNGRITIVTSGRFPETVDITGANGQVVIEAAPGVDANIDAVLAGDAGNTTRQTAPGIIVNTAANRRVVLRNLVSRNWSIGIEAMGDSHVIIDHCRLDGNRDYGIRAAGNAKVVITNSQVNGSGFRVNPMVDNTPNPGVGIAFEDSSDGAIASTTVTGSFAAGVANETRSKIQVSDVVAFDNNPNSRGKFKAAKKGGISGSEDGD